jgi:hypothetical protein
MMEQWNYRNSDTLITFELDIQFPLKYQGSLLTPMQHKQHGKE